MKKIYDYGCVEDPKKSLFDVRFPKSIPKNTCITLNELVMSVSKENNENVLYVELSRFYVKTEHSNVIVLNYQEYTTFESDKEFILKSFEEPLEIAEFDRTGTITRIIQYENPEMSLHNINEDNEITLKIKYKNENSINEKPVAE